MQQTSSVLFQSNHPTSADDPEPLYRSSPHCCVSFMSHEKKWLLLLEPQRLTKFKGSLPSPTLHVIPQSVLFRHENDSDEDLTVLLHIYIKLL